MRITKIQTLTPIALGLACLGLLLLFPTGAKAANPTTMNFQGKIVNADGTNVANSAYSIVFRIYNTASPVMTTSCTSTATCIWQETQASVTVTNGVFQVELGSACSLTSSSCNNTAGGPINFASSNSLYLTMQFNGDVSGSNGGFMSPTIHITSVPFAFQADNSSTLGGLAASNLVQLAQGLQTDSSTTNASISINKTNASGTPNILTLQKSGKNSLVVDNSGNVILGQVGASGLNGVLVFNNSAGSGTATITLAANPSTNYTYQLPTGTVSSNQCLQSGTVSAGTVPLTFSTCGSSTLASAYNSAGTTGNTITYTTAGAGIIIQDASTALTGNLLTLQNNAGTINFLTFNLVSSVPHLRVYDQTTNTNYADIYYDHATSSAVFTANTGTTKVGSGTGGVTIQPSAGNGVTITADANSTYTTTTGFVRLDGPSGIELGTATTRNGSLAFINLTNTNLINITVPSGASAPAAPYTLTLPGSVGSSNQCLQNSGTAGILTFATCGDSITVNGSAAADANFIDTAVSGTVAGTSWTLNTGSSPNTIALSVSNATGTQAGVVTNGTQSFGGNKTFTGTVLAQSASNSATAFVISNQSAAQVLGVDTTIANNTNVVANSSFESAISNWSAVGTGAASQSAAQVYEGNDSLLITSGATEGGASYSTSTTMLSVSTAYTMSAYIKTDSSTPIHIDMGEEDTVAGGLLPCLTTQLLPQNGGWQRFTCTFTTGATVSNSLVYIKQTSTDPAVTKNLYVDDILVQTDTNSNTNYRNGAIDLTGGVINGAVILQNVANSTNALQVENASGNTIFNVDTTDTNLISNPGFEANATGWALNGGAAIRRDSTQAYLGVYSLKVTASTTANNGAQFSLNPIVTATATTYTLSWYAKLDGSSSAMTDMAGLFSADGATTVACTPTSGTVVTGGWTRYSCSVASGATTPSTSGFVRILQTGTTAGHIYYIDGVQLEAASSASAYGAGAVSLNGVITSPVVFKAAAATTAFQIQNSSNLAMLVADSVNNLIQIGSGTTDANAIVLVLDSYNNATDPAAGAINGAMYYNTSTSTYRCYQGGAWRNCLGGGPSNQSTATQAPTAGTDTYLTGSLIPLPTGGFRGPTGSAQDGSKVTWRVVMTKTAAGTAASTFNIRVGTGGTTSDTLRCSAFSTGTATAVIDVATVIITVYATAGGSGTTLNCSATLTHETYNAATPAFIGWSNASAVQAYSTQTSFDSTPAGTKIGLSFNGGTSLVSTIQSVDVTTSNL